MVASPAVIALAQRRTLRRPDEPEIAYYLAPAEPARASVLVIHGYGEHAARYDETARAWGERGISVARFDLRGHGDSEGPRGHIERFEQYLSDTLAILDVLEAAPDFRSTGTPVLFGHSLGGLIALHAALRQPERSAGLVLSSPYLGLAFPVSPVKQALGLLLSRVWPGFSLPSGIRGRDLTRDAERATRFERDPRSFHHATARFFSETRRAQVSVFDEGAKLSVPIYCLQGGDDRVAAVEATRAFFSRLRANARLEVLPGVPHEPLNDLVRVEAVEKLGSAILRLPAERGAFVTR